MSTAIVKRGGVTSPSTSTSVKSCAFQQKSLDEGRFEEEKKEKEEKKEEGEEKNEKEQGRTQSSPPPCFLISEETLQKRLQDALRERDSQWIKHEKAQISFLQREGGSMLRGLHSEIDRLSNRLRESRRLLDVGQCQSEKDMADRLEEKEILVSELESALREKEERLAEIERKVTATMERMNEQITIQADRIRQLNGELQDRTQTVAQLSSQLRSYRLKEAMSIAQRRRRVSNASGGGGVSSPLVSPSSPHRSFPPFSTYPGGSQSARLSSRDQPSVLPLSSSSSNNIDDKPRVVKPRIRSNSAFGQPPQ
ncbi:hypothetical protein PFISCL1PPCAC_10563 [Pristionchus fissidentatus]|uniref:Uncharacterized protein n=1 Tax=Pristionchus fissidentatus TaxID=1538716 RepID=A0AAV5VKZ3_9BILA|nr:hypothetical protein PFISCL1PPCAC_10563 [Pristionchus fissidentatus]